jgi:hypothetical protein
MRIVAALLLLMVAGPGRARAQGELAYVPRSAPAYTADDARIAVSEADEAGHLRVSLPTGTWQLDLLNARGNVVERLAPDEALNLHAARLKPGTWTLRAHTPSGLLVRRMVVLGSSSVFLLDERPIRGRRR